MLPWGLVWITFSTNIMKKNPSVTSRSTALYTSDGTPSPGPRHPDIPEQSLMGKKRVHSIIIYGRREWMYISCPCCLRIAVNVVVNMDTACSAINFIFHLFYIFDFLIFFHAINDFRPNRKHISWHLRGQSDKWSEKINVQLQKTNAVFYAKIQQESALYLWLSPKFKRFWSISIKSQIFL